MATSYPRRNQASGLWRLSDITSNIKTEGTWPTSATTRGVMGGGSTPTRINVIEYITIASAGNATDFGDLIAGRHTLAGAASHTRGLFGGGLQTAPAGTYTKYDYINIASTGNAAEFGTLNVTSAYWAACGNDVRGVFGGGYVAPGAKNSMEYITFASLGNGTDFGNISSSRYELAGASHSTRGFFVGGTEGNPGAPYSVQTDIDFFQIATTANTVDFGDLTQARSGITGVASEVRAVFGGGITPTKVNTIDYVTIGYLGDATDFGDLDSTTGYRSATSNALRGTFAGGNTGSNINSIEYITIAQSGNGTDFGDLTAAKSVQTGLSNGHGGLEAFNPRYPSTPIDAAYGPHLSRGGAGRGNTAVFHGGSPASVSIDYFAINITGNSADFGD